MLNLLAISHRSNPTSKSVYTMDIRLIDSSQIIYQRALNRLLGPFHIMY